MFCSLILSKLQNMRNRHSFLLLLFFFSFQLSFAQEIPTPRASGHLFYFKPTQSLILLDGYEKGAMPSSGRAETWAWKNNSWTKIDTTTQPLRSLSGASYLPDREMIFVFGGVGSRGYDDSLRDAWTYDTKRWTRTDGKGIGTRDHHEMAYDEANKTIIVYGGQNGKREFDSRTWLFRNNSWTVLNIPGPGPRAHHAMAYDAVRKKTVLYGGSRANPAGETWEFDGIQWSKIEPSLHPGNLAHHSMVYDPVGKRVLLYGGQINMAIKGDIWAWDGKNWERISDNGPARILPAIAFNTDNNKLYVFGGNGGDQATSVFSDLWEWNGKKWTQVEQGKIYKWDMSKDRYVIIQ